MPQFVGITHDIDGNNAAILNMEGGGLENVAALDGDEAREAVDKTILHRRDLLAAKTAANRANSCMTGSSPVTGAP